MGRAIWVNYKITDKRVSVASTSPLNMEKLDATYDQMVEVRAIGRGVGLWGDMVIVLNDGAKIEIRCIDRCAARRPSNGCASHRALAPQRSRGSRVAARRWQEIKAYIEKQMAEAAAAKETRLAGKRRNA